MVMHHHPELSVRRQCDLLGLARSGIYYHPRPARGSDEELLRRGSGDTIYERAFVKRGRCRFCVTGLPHIPFRRRLRSIWPISDLSADEWLYNPQHIL